MMRYTFAQHLLLRMPAMTPADYQSDHQFFLNDLLFRLALYLASPVFYAALERYNFKNGQLEEKEITTLQKYINRYCFRPTPFGLFSSVSLLNWSISQQKSNHYEYNVHASASMRIQNLIYSKLPANHQNAETTYVGNTSLYRLMNEIRFFRSNLDHSGRQRDYQLQSIAFSKWLRDLIDNCSTGSTLEVIATQIRISVVCTIEEAEEYASFLVEAQILVPSQRLSITGADPLTELQKRLNDGKLRNELNRFLTLLAHMKFDINPTAFKNLGESVNNLLGDRSGTNDKLNIILERISAGPTPPEYVQEQLRNGLTALELLAPTTQITSLTQFVTNFQQHFEGQSLPLLLALDPEAGVGYQRPEKERNNPLLETIDVPHKNQPWQMSQWSAGNTVIMEAWLRDLTDHPVIRLGDEDLDRLKLKAIDQPMLGMSVLFRLTEDKVFIENAGGINAPALLGRFTVIDEEFAKAAVGMARHLEKLYPDVIFAEILHLSDPHTDNVNRRAHVYQYEIPVTAASLLPPSQQIQLSDLVVRIVDHKIMLYSEKHGKVVIPRLTSAYNHSINALPIFRFLADLPFQYARSNLSLDLRTLFPGLSFYPRVEYKEAILSLATWILSKTRLEVLQQSDHENNVAAFSELSQSIKLPRFFSIAESDQELVFDACNNADVRFFCKCIRNKKEVIIKEFLKQPVIRQYNAYLLPEEAAVLPKFNPAKPKIQNKRKYMPGSEWLYLKVYVPKIAVNRLLLRLSPLMARRYGKHKIGLWFFIRYEDHAPHIRLRLKVHPEVISEVLLAFKSKLEDRVRQHVIREFQIDVYSRELERYAAGGIENTEYFFWASSGLVLEFLKMSKARIIQDAYILALRSVFTIISHFIYDIEAQIQFALSSFEQFLPEFSGKSIRVQLDKKYRELSPEITTAFNTTAETLSGNTKADLRFSDALKVISNHLKETADRIPYLRGIIHMHLNRIFTDEPRKQEMICYYLLHKYLLSVKGRYKKNLNKD